MNTDRPQQPSATEPIPMAVAADVPDGTIPENLPVALHPIPAAAAEAPRYSVSHLHAAGAIGQVWVATDGLVGREVALKDLRPERAVNPAAWRRFLHEARITGRLQHPGIVPVYEIGT